MYFFRNLMILIIVIVVIILFYFIKRVNGFNFLRTQYYFPEFFSGKTIIITGASSGLGEALAFKACQYGARVVMTGRNMVGLELARQKLLAHFVNMQINIACPPILSILDLTNSQSISNFVQEYLKLFDNVPPDILINNAGISYRGNIVDTLIPVDRLLMETNYFGPVQLIKAFLPFMIQRHSGIIVNISSLQGKLSIPFRSAYSASKHALQAFSDCLRAEVGHYNISVCVVSPGYINTKLSVNAINPDGSIYNKLDRKTARGMDPLTVAEKILCGLTRPHLRSGEILIIPFKYRVALFCRWFVPNLYFDMMFRRAQKRKIF